MKAIILAAGQGTRLRPLTDERPKCMVELAGVSLLERQLKVLAAAGIVDITVVAGYRRDALKAPGCRVVVNEAFATTNMVASLMCARAELTAETDIIVSYGDIVYEPQVISAVMAADAPLCVAVDVAWRQYWAARMPDPLADAETLKLDADGRIVELGKTPTSYEEINGQYIGLFKIRAGDDIALLEAYDAIDRRARFDGRDFDNMYMTSFIQYLIDRGWTAKAVPIHNGWLETDSVADLGLYETIHRAGTLRRFCDLRRAGGIGDARSAAASGSANDIRA